MRKPLFLAILGVSAVVSGASLGTALTRYLSLRAYTPKAPGAATARDGTGSIPPPVDEWKNPFSPSQGMKVPSRIRETAGGTTVAVSRGTYVLVGTIHSATPSARRAILWSEGMKEPRAYRETEEVEPGTVIASIERDEVWLARGSEREKLVLLPVGSRSRANAAPPAVPGPPAAQDYRPSAAPPPDVSSSGGKPAGNDEEEAPRRKRRPARGRQGR